MPAAVDEVIQRATAKEAGARFADIPAMVRALHQAAQKNGQGYARPADFIQIEEELVNPYKGLRAFQEADAVNFFGRQALVEQLLARFASEPAPSAVPADRFLAVIGPSGSGKSSVVKAGLLPALRHGAVPGSAKWFMVEMIPGAHPLEELETVLLRIAVDPPASLLDQLREDEGGLTHVLEQLLPDDDSELVLLIDQFEELFTLVDEDERRTHFINSLLVALNHPNSMLRLLITVRADFYDRPLMTPGLAELMRHCTEIVTPLTRAELEEAIVQPSLQAGALFETGLVPGIINDVSEQPGALPLLQYALTELFERRQERLLTKDAYNEIGGVLGALGRRAEELYAELDEEGEEAARQLFMRLVTLGEGTEDTRRRVLRSELTALVGAVRELPLQGVQVLETVIERYGRYRLLTFDHDPLTREPTVEVAHEALLREWPRLWSWLDESRDDVRLQRSLAALAAEWVENHRQDGFLLRGSRLDLFAGWAAGTTIALTTDEQVFLQTSVASRQQREAAEQARQQRELQTAQKLAREQTKRAEEQSRSAQRLRLLVAGLAVVLLLALGAAWLAVSRGQEAQANANLAATREAEALAEAEQRATSEAVADSARQDAEQQAQIAFSRELAAAALNNLDSDPERSVLLAVQAMREARTQEAEEALHQAIPNLRVAQTLVGHEDDIASVAFSPDGAQLLTASYDGTARVWDVHTGQELMNIFGHENSADIALFSPDGTFIVTGAGDGVVRVIDAATGELRRVLTGHRDSPNAYDPGEPNWVDTISISPDSKIIATGSSDGTARLWDAATGAERQILTIPDENIVGIRKVEFSPDGTWLAMWGVDQPIEHHVIQIVDLESGDIPHTLVGTPEQRVGNFAISPDGSRMLIGDGTDTGEVVRLWDLEAAAELARYPVGEHNDLDFSPDGSLFMTNALDGGAHIWDIETGDEVLRLSGHHDRVWVVAFSPDGTQIATGSADDTVRIWDIGLDYEYRLLQPFGDHELVGVSAIAFSPDGNMLATAGMVGGLSIWDASSGANLLDLSGHDDFVGGLAFSPDGLRLASASDDTTIKIWDTVSGELLQTITAHEDWVNNLAYSPDGATFASVDNDRQAIIWDADTGKPIHTLSLTEPAWAIAYGQDGTLLATGESEELFTIWDVSTGEPVQEFTEQNGADDLLFSADGSKLITGGYDGAVRIWDIDAGSLLKEIPAHQGLVWGLALNPDGSTIATGSADRTARLWDIDTGQRLLTLTGARLPLTDVEFSPDGTRLATSSVDGAVRIYLLTADELLALAESRVTRSLTREECQEYLHLDACPD